MAVLTLVNSVAGNAIIGSVATKLFDSLVTSKFSQKNDKKKWIREKKLNLFSNLSEEILTINCDNLIQKRKIVKEISSKIILLIEDKSLKENLKNYSFILDEYECYKNDINLYTLNDELIQTLSKHMKKM